MAPSKRMLGLPPGSSCKKFSVQKIILGKNLWLDIGERKRMRRFATRLLGPRLSYSRFLLGRHLDIQNTYSYIPHHHSQFRYLIFWGLGSLLEFQYLSFSFVSIPPQGTCTVVLHRGIKAVVVAIAVGVDVADWLRQKLEKVYLYKEIENMSVSMCVVTIIP